MQTIQNWVLNPECSKDPQQSDDAGKLLLRITFLKALSKIHVFTKEISYFEDNQNSTTNM